LSNAHLVLKGIATAEDATLAVEHGADGVIVSNHGSRVETGRGTIDILRGRIPVLVDGGFRRGSDVCKALAIGARAVGIGRPYIYGLASFGQEGVERVLDILRAELALMMRQCGTPAIAQIRRASVLRNGLRL
jgi:4-hydroxymandelate oxidase